MKLPGHWIFFAHYNLRLQYDTLNILGYQKHLYITNLRHVQICKYYHICFVYKLSNLNKSKKQGLERL